MKVKTLLFIVFMELVIGAYGTITASGLLASLGYSRLANQTWLPYIIGAVIFPIGWLLTEIACSAPVGDFLELEIDPLLWMGHWFEAAGNCKHRYWALASFSLVGALTLVLFGMGYGIFYLAHR